MLDTPFVLCDTEESDWAERSPEGSIYEMDEERRTPFRSWTRLVQHSFMGQHPTVLDLKTPEGVAGLDQLRQWASEGVIFVIHNSLYDLPKLWKLGIRPTQLFDTMTASQMIWCGAIDKRHSLDLVIQRETGLDPYGAIVLSKATKEADELLAAGKISAEQRDAHIQSAIALGKKVLQKSDWSRDPLTAEQVAYAAADVGNEYRDTAFSLDKQIKDYGLEAQFALEMQILPIVAQMSEDGIKFNLYKWKKFIAEQTQIDTEMRETLHKQLDLWNQQLFPQDYLITLRRKSPLPEKRNRKGEITQEAQTVGDLMKIQPRPKFIPYDAVLPELAALENGDTHIGARIRTELGLANNPEEELVSITKPKHLRPLFNALLATKGEGFDEAEVTALLDLAKKSGKQDVADWLELYQKEAKLRKLVSTYGESYWKYADPAGYIHARFSTTDADTNRIQASEPNVLNAPRFMQKMLWCVEEGEAQIKADYSAQEARLLFYLGNQRDVYARLLNGLDIHTMSLSMFLNRPYDDLVIKGGTKDKVKPELDDARSDMKPLTFAPCFGAGPGKVASILGVPFKQGKEWLDRYWATYPEVKKMQEAQAYKAVHLGYVTDLSFGRKRFFFRGKKQQELLDQGKSLEDACYDFRNPAFNYACQATGATILRFALLNVSKFIQDHPEYGAKLRLTVHDAIVLSCKKEHAEEVGFHLKQLMELSAREVVPGIHIGADLDIYYDKTAPATFDKEDYLEQTQEPTGTDPLREEYEVGEGEDSCLVFGDGEAGEPLA